MLGYRPGSPHHAKGAEGPDRWATWNKTLLTFHGGSWLANDGILISWLIIKYSLKLTANAPENRPGPKRKRSYSNHPFSGAMLVSGRVLINPYITGYYFILYIKEPTGVLNTAQMECQLKKNWRANTVDAQQKSGMRKQTPAMFLKPLENDEINYHILNLWAGFLLSTVWKTKPLKTNETLYIHAWLLIYTTVVIETESSLLSFKPEIEYCKALNHNHRP